MADGEGAAVRKALTEAADSLGKNLGNDAARAFRNLYKDSKAKIEQIVKRTAESDAESAGKLEKIVADVKANAESDASKAEKLGNQTNLYKKFKSILGPEAHGEAEGGKLASDLLKPPEGEGKVPWIGGDRKNGSLLGHLPGESVERDADELITHVKVGGEKVPVDDYVKNLADERRGIYQDAQQAGTFTKGDTGAAMAVGVDRRTGAVYEGFNGRPGVDVIQPDEIHDTIGRRVEQMEQDGPYPGRGGGEMKYPADDNPFGHAEVKAANSMLNARQEAGLPSGPGALGEMSFAPQFPFAKHSPEARTCPNCTAILDGAHLLYGTRGSYGL